MKYVLELAGITVQLNIPFDVKISDECKDFMTFGENIHKNVDIVFHPVENLSCKNENGHWQELKFYQKDIIGTKIYNCMNQKGDAFACIHWYNPSKNKGTCMYNANYLYKIQESRSIFNSIGIEDIMLSYQRIILHASFIKYDSKGILFSAPSGTGKSTQAELWKKYEHADIINGDKVGILVSEECTAYGLPYAGTSGIYRNESTPLNVIVVLRQASENCIQKLNEKEAFRYLFSETIIHSWDKEFTENAVDLLIQLIKKVPVYRLDCLPDKEAVEIVKRYCL